MNAYLRVLPHGPLVIVEPPEDAAAVALVDRLGADGLEHGLGGQGAGEGEHAEAAHLGQGGHAGRQLEVEGGGVGRELAGAKLGSKFGVLEVDPLLAGIWDIVSEVT